MIRTELATSTSVTSLRCRDDILQAMFWMRGEGFRHEVDASALSVFLALDRELVSAELRTLAEDGLLLEANAGYRLTPVGAREGGRRFADEFAGLQHTAHAECGPDCPYCAGTPRDACMHCAPVPEGPTDG